jgi:hypothetical protein
MIKEELLINTGLALMNIAPSSLLLILQKEGNRNSIMDTERHFTKRC